MFVLLIVIILILTYNFSYYIQHHNIISKIFRNWSMHIRINYCYLRNYTKALSLRSRTAYFRFRLQNIKSW